MRKQRLQLKKRLLLSGSLCGCLLAFTGVPLSAGAQTTAANEWTWMSGSSTLSCTESADLGNYCLQPGVYGTLGTPAAGNVPGSRVSATSWTDNSGNLWLYSGGCVDANGNSGSCGDFWEFNPTTDEWTWMGGSTSANQSALVYGVMGTPAAGNFPGNRVFGASWTDPSGNFWAFGGDVSASGWGAGLYDDLWEFNPTTNEWTWIGGSTSGNSTGVYGTLGTPDAGNIPPARVAASSWTDSSGNLWLFGGKGGDEASVFNDLWEFNPSTNQWAWMSGSSVIGNNCPRNNGTGSDGPTLCGQPGVDGTLGTPAAGNTPGGREYAASWTDSSGHFWLFGGGGMDANGVAGELNDLWEFDPSLNEWAWMGGSSNVNQSAAVYGVMGVPAAGNVPEGRWGASSWSDKSGNFWLFGGSVSYGITNLNDLWEYNPTTNLWAWMGGSSSNNQPGVYGTLGTAAAGNIPGSRWGVSSWTDSSGNFWLFGGMSVDGNSDVGYLNDLWEYQPSAPSLPASATPTFNPAAGTYTTTQTVTILDSTPHATIYYTTDGVTIPTINSSVYSSGNPITVSSTETIQAMAVATNYLNSAVATAVYTINLPQAATPTFSVAAGSYTAAQTVILTDATAGATIYYTADGTQPTTSSTVYNGPIAVSSTETLEAMATASGYFQSDVAVTVYTVTISTNPVPVIGSISPASASAGGADFTLMLNGYEFTANSTVYWGTSALATQYVNANQLTAQVTAADITGAGITAVTVQTPTPGGGTSNSFQFEVDSASGSATAPAFSSTTATVTTGSPASYTVTLPASVEGTSVSCLNLPTGASCSYSSATNTVTITTSATTPKGTYQITMVFTETVSGAASSWILLPILLLPLYFLRRKLAARGVWATACLGLVLLAGLALTTGCGGGGGGSGCVSNCTPPPSHQVTTSATVTLIIK
jgi:N-acetylneuraminic acid mutarotase